MGKSEGGLAFILIGEFNQAVVVKHVWNIIYNPNSLLARILKGRYFYASDILQAEAGVGASYTWRSLLWGRNLLLKGLH